MVYVTAAGRLHIFKCIPGSQSYIEAMGLNRGTSVVILSKLHYTNLDISITSSNGLLVDCDAIVKQI